MVTFPKLAVEGVTVRPGCTALPVTGMTALAPWLLAMVILPVMFSDALGLNDTVNAAFCPATNVAGVVMPVALKSFAFTVICEMVIALLPAFVMVMLLEVELPAFTPGKLMLLGLAVSVTVAAVPVPLKETTLGEVGALLITLIDPVSTPAVVGANSALKVAFPPAATATGVANPLTLYPLPATDS